MIWKQIVPGKKIAEEVLDESGNAFGGNKNISARVIFILFFISFYSN